MPAPSRLITVNLGSQTIGLAEFRVAHGALVLVDYRLREAPLDSETGQRRDELQRSRSFARWNQWLHAQRQWE